MEKTLIFAIAFFISISFYADAQAVKKTSPEGIVPRYVEGEILVKYKSHVPESIRTANNARQGARKIKRFKKIGVDHLALPNGMQVEEAVKLFKANPDVEYAEPNYILHIEAVPDDSRFDELWGLHNTGQTIDMFITGTPDADIDAPEAWDVTTGSENVIIAVLDTGIDYDHPDLAENIWHNPDEICGDGIDNDGNNLLDDCIGYDFINNDSDPLDDYFDFVLTGHGTHVSGTIAARGNNTRGVVGVSWAGSVMPLKILDSNGDGPVSSALAAIEYANAKGARIINCSWGFLFDSSLPFTQTINSLKEAIESVPHILFVCAAGNDGLDTDVDPFHFPSGFDSPNIISVAASNHLDELSSASNFGQTSVDLAAPGRFILSTFQADRNTSFTENFESYSGLINTSAWISDGSWELTNAASSSYQFSLTDSVGGNYAPNASSIINSPGLAVGAGCSLHYRLMLETEAYADFLFVEASADAINGPWTILSSHSGSTAGEFKTFVDSFSSTGGANPMFIRFRLTSDNSNEFDGAYIDNVKVLCPFLDPEYGFSSGTSMAAAHVSGTAALIKSDKPSLTSLQIKEIMLSSVDVRDSLISNTVSSGRLNAFKSILLARTPVRRKSDDDDHCFIATAAYGSYLAPEVSSLRKFRDEYLLTNAPGRAFVELYYEHSPGMARIISKHGPLRFLMRTALAPLVYGVNYPHISTVIVALGISGILYWIRTRRKENHVQES